MDKGLGERRLDAPAVRAFAEDPPARRVGQRLAVGVGDRPGGLAARLADAHLEHVVALALRAVCVRRHDKRLQAMDAFVQHSLAHTHPALRETTLNDITAGKWKAEMV